MSRTTIFTSIAPRGIENQQRAVGTWLGHGFDVVSLNVGEEIDTLTEAFPEVRFEPVTETGQEWFGKPLVFINSIIDAARASSVEVFGIVNSDIHFEPEPDLAERLAHLARKELVFGTRLDVETLEDQDGEEYDVGFDFFFMTPDHAAIYPRARFCLGAPLWDYWMPLAAIASRRVPVLLKRPVARHVRQPLAWTDEQNLLMLGEIVQHAGIDFEDARGVDFSDSNPAARSFLGVAGPFMLDFIYQHSRRRALPLLLEV